jgi:hypothetical protein
MFVLMYTEISFLIAQRVITNVYYLLVYYFDVACMYSHGIYIGPISFLAKFFIT